MTTKRVPKKAEALRVWIKRELEDAGSSYAAIGRELGVSRQAVRIARSSRIREAIAGKIGLPIERIWSGRSRVKSSSVNH
jgi:lambda repressor-like predicted transcriptional regulator